MDAAPTRTNNTTALDLSAAVASEETLTVLSIDTIDPDGVANNGDEYQQLTYQDEDGNTTALDLSAAVASEETLTVLSIDTIDPDGVANNGDEYQQ